MLTMHHIVSDGWSIGVFVARAGGAVRGLRRAGSPSPLPELPIQYADFAVWQRQWLQGEVLEAQLGVLEGAARRRAAGAGAARPTGRARAVQTLPRRDRVPFALPRDAVPRRSRRSAGARGRRCS